MVVDPLGIEFLDPILNSGIDIEIRVRKLIDNKQTGDDVLGQMQFTDYFCILSFTIYSLIDIH